MEKQEDTALLEFDVHINAGVLYDYLLKHTYSGLQGILATIIGILLILLFLSGSGILYLIFGLVVIVYIPVSLFLSASRQALQVEAFQKPLHYRMLEEGIEVSQGDVVELQAWEGMVKAISTAKSIIVYTSPVKAAIFPRNDLGDASDTLIEIICKHMDPKKVKIRR
ncbi:MAG: YcxB family protein [Lachnospiraceae bacterium]|nr:YcxB family protein [Lachnospiraceae bacterium]